MAYPRAMGIAFINKFLNDQCVITRRPNSNRNDTLNLETFELERDDDDETIFEGGCALQSFTSKDRDYDIGAFAKIKKGYRVLLTADTVGPDVGDTLTLSECAFNHELENVPLRVAMVIYGTHPVYTLLWVEDVRPDRETPMP